MRVKNSILFLSCFFLSFSSLVVVVVVSDPVDGNPFRIGALFNADFAVVEHLKNLRVEFLGRGIREPEEMLL